MADKFTVLVTDDRHGGDYSIEESVLKAIGARVAVCPDSPESEFERLRKEADAFLVNLRKIDAAVIADAKKCRIVSRYGVGYDNVDLEAATAAGVWVSNVPDYSVEEVSDHAAALMLASSRLVSYKDKAIRAGEWNVLGGRKVYRMAGKTLGIVGYGRIARLFHAKMKGWSFGETLVYDPFIPDSVVSAAGARKVELAELMAKSDFISVHAPLTKETRHLIGRKEIGSMKSSAVLVNTARGGVIDQAALTEALERKLIRGAGLDVFEVEPLPAGDRLRALDNVILTDHCSYHSEESMVELKRKAAENIREALSGRKPNYPVNAPK